MAYSFIMVIVNFELSVRYFTYYFINMESNFIVTIVTNALVFIVIDFITEEFLFINFHNYFIIKFEF